MNCSNCGNQLEENWQFCPKCNTLINKISCKKDYSLIYVVIFIISSILTFFASDANMIFYIVSLITIVTAKITYPFNNLIKILFWIFVGVSIAGIIFYIMALITCMGLISTFAVQMRGCG